MGGWSSGVPDNSRPRVSRSIITGRGVARRDSTSPPLPAPTENTAFVTSREQDIVSEKTPSVPSIGRARDEDMTQPPKLSISYKVKGTARGIITPEVDEFFVIKNKDRNLLEVVEMMSKDDPQNVMLVGPQGCGKTELAVWFAAKFNRPLLVMNCAYIRETKDWFGFRDAKAGTLTWHRSEFVRAVTMGNAVVLLDEFNRLHATLHNSLYPLLDARRSSFIEDLEETIAVAPGTVFFATANIGIQHTGTFTMDSAMEDRWGTRIDVGFLKEAEEVDIIVKKTGLPKQFAVKLGTLATKIRAKANSDSTEATLTRTISTRQLLHCAAMMRYYLAKSLPPASVFDYCLVPYFSKDGGRESEQAQVLQIIQGVFGAR